MRTNGKSKAAYAVAAGLLLLVVGDQAMGQETPSTTPSIVFVGTVEAVEAVTLPEVTVSPNTSVVTIDKVIRKPDSVALLAGDKVTVLTEGTGPQKGVQALFFSDGWIFGNSVAVRARSWEPVASAKAAGADDARATAQLQAAADKELQKTLESADLVIVGRVKKIQPPSLTALAPEKQMISEHNPDWHEATVEVQSVLKGAPDMKEAVIRFPASMDVMWVNYPKFKEGQEGTFILQQDRISGSVTAQLQNKVVTAYTAVSSKHTLSSGDAERVKGLLQR